MKSCFCNVVLVGVSVQERKREGEKERERKRERGGEISNHPETYLESIESMDTSVLFHHSNSSSLLIVAWITLQ